MSIASSQFGVALTEPAASGHCCDTQIPLHGRAAAEVHMQRRTRTNHSANTKTHYYNTISISYLYLYLSLSLYIYIYISEAGRSCSRARSCGRWAPGATPRRAPAIAVRRALARFPCAEAAGISKSKGQTGTDLRGAVAVSRRMFDGRRAPSFSAQRCCEPSDIVLSCSKTRQNQNQG